MLKYGDTRVKERSTSLHTYVLGLSRMRTPPVEASRLGLSGVVLTNTLKSVRLAASIDIVDRREVRGLQHDDVELNRSEYVLPRGMLLPAAALGIR